MKMISLLLSLFLASSLVVTSAHAGPGRNLLRDPGDGPITPWPVDFPRDPIIYGNLAGTWSSASSNPTTWTLKIERTDLADVYRVQVNSDANPGDVLIGIGKVFDNVLFVYWMSHSNLGGYLTIHLFEGRLHILIDENPMQLTELFDKSIR